MTKVACASCVYLDTTTDKPFCRRNPPQLVVIVSNTPLDEGVRRFFPVVDPNLDWCGEFSTSRKRSKKTEV